jgi:hypothetical protein
VCVCVCVCATFPDTLPLLVDADPTRAPFYLLYSTSRHIPLLLCAQEERKSKSKDKKVGGRCERWRVCVCVLYDEITLMHVGHSHSFGNICSRGSYLTTQFRMNC